MFNASFVLFLEGSNSHQSHSTSTPSVTIVELPVREKLSIVSPMPDDKRIYIPENTNEEDVIMNFNCCANTSKINDYLCAKCGVVLRSGSVHFNCNLCGTVVCSECMRSNNGGHEHPMKSFRISSS